MKLITLFLSLLVGIAFGDVNERSTGIQFKSSLKLPGASSSETLAATGVRVKKLGPAPVKVYAVGIYLDRVKALYDLSKYRGMDSSALLSSSDFYRDVKSKAFEKTLVLKMARKVGAKKMVDALAESVKPRLGLGGMEALEKFQTILLEAVSKEGDANKGMQFGFVCKHDSLCVSIDGKLAGTIKSAQLRNAMLDVYLGKDAVSPTAKKSFAEGMAGFFK